MGTFISQEETPLVYEDGDKEVAPGQALRPGWGYEHVFRMTDAMAIKNALLDCRTAIRALQASGGTSTHAHYSTDTAQSMPAGADTIVDFEDAEITNAAVTVGAAWKFTAPADGVYVVSAMACLDYPNPHTGPFLNLSLYLNGGFVRWLQSLSFVPSDAVARLMVGGSTLVEMEAGDYVDIRLNHGSGGALFLAQGAAGNWVSIHSVGA